MNDRTNLPAMVSGQSFGGTSHAVAMVDSASAAAASQAKALVEARYIMALHRPRNWDQVRQDILRECKRPSFAHNKSTYYRKPIGQGVEGLGIRFAEAALRCMTNVTIDTMTVHSDPLQEIVKVTVTDLEANVPYSLDVTITKTVERSKPNDDGSYVSMRLNSRQNKVYTVQATDEDMLNKRGALISKAVRTLALRLLPGDIQDEAIELIKSIRLDDAAKDPTAERKRIVDAFGELSVRASDLQAYLGHSIDSCSPAELVELRGYYGAIRDGEATWAQVMDAKAEREGDDKKPATSLKPAYPPEDFDKALKKWNDLVAKGKKKVEELVATAQSRNTLSPEQLAAIRALEPKSEPDPTAPASDDAVAAMLEKAEAATIGAPDILKHLGRAELGGITNAELDKALAFIADPVGASK